MTSTLKQLAEKVAELDKANTRLLAAELEKKEAQAAVDQLREVDIPKLMDEVGVATITTSGGLTVNITEQIFTRIPADRKGEAFAWLDENGHSGLIRRDLKVPFLKTETEACQKLAESLKERYPDLSVELNVHPSTLRAFVTRELPTTFDFPRDLFGVYVKRQANIKK